MIKKVSIIIILLAIATSMAHAQLIRMNNRLVIAGMVVDATDSSPLAYVNIYVKHTRSGTITDTSGYFLLFANVGDTIIFSSLGYEKLHVVATDTLGDIARPAFVEMKRTVYELSSVDIIALRRYQQFKYEVINMKLPEDDYVRAANNFPIRPVDLDYYTRQGASGFGLIFHPITALYDAFSKEGKERRKLAEVTEQDSYRAAVEQKYNLKMVMRVTGLNDTEAGLFMKWMNLSDPLVINASEYQLIEIIMMQFVKYQKQQ
ncbi:MAG TPA: carboxypeptidase-like regulatory domain-containing protein [Bacteroidales bacterium]|nr:carboxypeptidase-like regulatory domain-containing protein [Bacteroidales bacterium]